MNNTNGEIAELIGLLDEKKKLFDKIMKITLEQKKDIEENKANKIEELVGRKQLIINSIDEIDKSFSEKFDLLKKQLGTDALEKADIAKHPMLKALKPKVETIMSLARDIMQIEESNKEKLSGIISGVKKEIKQLSLGKKSIKAYERPDINNDGIYIDKKK